MSATTANNPENLVLQNTITELDLMLPDLTTVLGLDSNRAVTLAPDAHTSLAKDITLPELADSVELGRHQEEDELAGLADDDLELDIGEDIISSEARKLPSAPMYADEGSASRDNQPTFVPSNNDEFAMPQLDDEDDFRTDMSIEVGRDAVLGSGMIEDFSLDLENDDLQIPDMAADEEEEKAAATGDDVEMLDVPQMEQYEPLTPIGGNELANEILLRSEEVQFVLDSPSTGHVSKRSRSRAPASKKVKIDDVTELRSSYIKNLQEDRSSITRSTSFLPFEKEVISLLSLCADPQELAKTVFRPLDLNPALSDLLEPAYVSEMVSRKRKSVEEQDVVVDDEADHVHLNLTDNLREEHSSELADLNVKDRQDDNFIPQLDDDDSRRAVELTAEDDFRVEEYEDGDMIEMPSTKDSIREEMNEEDLASTQVSGSGVSKYTKEAAAILQSELSKSSTVEFHKLTENCSRPEAVKLFFETLVLVTKEALEVGQKEAFGTINIKAKKGLFEQEWMSSQLPTEA